VEARHHRIAEERVRQRDQRHALVVREIGPDDGTRDSALAPGRVIVRVRVAIGVIDRVEEPKIALEAGGAHPPQVRGASHRVDHRGERRRVGSHDELVAKPRFRPRLGTPKALC
jgi:hypothetical protein